MLDKKSLRRVLTLLKYHYRDATTALTYHTPFQLLISTVLAAQSTDQRVNMVTKELFKKYNSPRTFLKLTIPELEEKIRTVGLYKIKAKNILRSCKILVERYHGEIPTNREELMQLPGVGRKTANVVLSLTTDFQAIAVDTHVFRVANRLGLAEASNVLQTENQLMRHIPETNWSAAHHWLIWHGRKICQARHPLCTDCFLALYCRFNNLHSGSGYRKSKKNDPSISKKYKSTC
jgi:endonuclease-3